MQEGKKTERERGREREREIKREELQSGWSRFEVLSVPVLGRPAIHQRGPVKLPHPPPRPHPCCRHRLLSRERSLRITSSKFSII